MANYGIIVRDATVGLDDIVLVYDSMKIATAKERQLRDLDSEPHREDYLKKLKNITSNVREILTTAEIVDSSREFTAPENRICMLNRCPIPIEGLKELGSK